MKLTDRSIILRQNIKEVGNKSEQIEYLLKVVEDLDYHLLREKNEKSILTSKYLHLLEKIQGE